MKLDIDLIKSLLAFVEESPNYPKFIVSDDIKINGTDPLTIAYHLSLMLEAGLIRGRESCPGTPEPYVAIERLTWEGHAFLANSKDPTNWQKLKSAIATIGDVSFDVAKAGLAGMASAAVSAAMLGGSR